MTSKGRFERSPSSVSIHKICELPKVPHSVAVVAGSCNEECDKPDLSYQLDSSLGSDYESISVGPHEKPKAVRRSTLLPKAKLEDLQDYIPFENVFHVDQKTIDRFNTRNSKNTKRIFDMMLQRHASLNIATEVATAQVEALMDKCLGSPVEPDIDLPNLLDFVNQVDTVKFFLKQSGLSASELSLVLEKAVDKLIGDWKAKTKTTVSSEIIRRHREELQNADPSVDPSSTFAVRRSRGG